MNEGLPSMPATGPQDAATHLPQIPDHELLRRIGRGSYGEVWLARNVMGQILDHGKVTRGYLGVVIQPISPARAKQLGLSKLQGALVGDVSSKGPAQSAGVQRGDVIQLVRHGSGSSGSIGHVVFIGRQTKNWTDGVGTPVWPNIGRV